MADGNNSLLQQIRTRAQDLQKTLMQAIFDLETAPERYDWPNVLERFAVMNAQLRSIGSQMVPLMEHYIVHPKAVDQQMAPVLPIMLASKLLPEQEEQQHQQLADFRQKQALTDAKQQAGYVTHMTDSVNRLVDFLVAPQEGQPQSGMLDANKGQLRREIARSSCVPRTSVPGGQRTGAAQAKPVSQKLEGPDLFLAVVSRGHGIPRPEWLHSVSALQSKYANFG
ncbi:hypothetical protein ABBQ32_001009 [Trebouxia sp. C0010 RCD-2024]